MYAAALSFRCPCGDTLLGSTEPDSLADIDANRLPYPVALTFIRLRKALADDVSPLAILFAAKDCFEASVKYLGSVLVVEYLSCPARTPERDTVLLGKLVRPALGHWVNEICRPASEWLGAGPAALLFSTPGKGKPTQTELFRQCRAFVDYRNDALGHGAARSDAQYREDLDQKCLPPLTGLLAGITTLAGRPLVLVTAEDRAQLWMGPHPSAGTVPGAYRREHIGQFALAPRSGESGVLPLFPFLSYLPNPKEQHRLHFYDSLYRYTATRKEATVLEYDGGERHPRPEPLVGFEDAFTADLLARAFKAYRGRMAVIEGRVANFGELIETHAGIVGRKFAIETVQRFLRDNDRGLLVIEAEPGKGKTALLAHLIEAVFGSFSPRPAHFFYRRTAGIADPDVCVNSLYHSLLEAHGITEAEEARRQTTPELVYNKLVNLLGEEISPKLSPGRPQLIVIDALDEASRDAFERVPENLPAGVYVIASTRPVARRATLARRANLHWFRLDAPDHLQENLRDGREYVRRELIHTDVPDATQQELARVGGGNFLVLKLMCRHVLSGVPADDVRALLRRLAAGAGTDHLGFVYAEFWGRIQAQCPPQFAQALLEVAGVLVLSHAPLTADVICSVLGLTGAAWDFASRHLMEYLTAIRHEEAGAEETYYRVYHESFADFLRAKLTGRDRHELRGKWAEYCRGWADLPDGFGRAYAVRFGPRHLVDAGRLDDAVALITDWRFLEAKSEAGFVAGLVADFCGVLGRLPPAHEWHHRLALLHEALRREANFLARRPQCLFQQMWNLCWWYDHPSAADHHDLSTRTGTGPPPWARDGPKLYRFMEAWRAGRHGRQAAFTWLRSLRPPPTQLGTSLRAVLRGHTGWVLGVSWSPDSRHLATASQDGSIRVWDVTTGEQQWSRWEGTRVDGLLRCVAWSPDGRTLAAGVEGGVHFLDPADGAERRPPFRTAAGALSLAWSPDGRFLASGGGGRAVSVWDAADGREVFHTAGERGGVYAVSWSPDGRFLAAAMDGEGGNPTIPVWDVMTGQERFRLRGHEQSIVSGVAYSPDGRFIATCGSDQTLRIWDADTGAERRVFRDIGWALCLCWSQDGRHLVAESGDQYLRVWDAATGAVRARLPGLEGGQLRAVSWSPDGRSIAGGTDYAGVYVWNATGGEESLTLIGHETSVTGMAWSSNGTVFATAGMDDTLRLWDAASGRQQWSAREPGSGARSVCWSRDKLSIVYAGKLWDPLTGNPREEPPGENEMLGRPAGRDVLTLMNMGSSGKESHLWRNPPSDNSVPVAGFEVWVSPGSPGGMLCRLWPGLSGEIGRAAGAVGSYVSVYAIVRFDPDGTAEHDALPS